MAGGAPAELASALAEVKKKASAEKASVATRKASEAALEAINGVWPLTVGGSADLTPSNNTKTRSMHSMTADDYSGRYIHYGIREHGMAAAMSGMALHGGIVPYGGTFLTFSDYCRPSIRLAALMGLRVVYVMTHDSIGLGEDGPTHQPVEHLASLRAIPNLMVYRPADAVETAEAWQLALDDRSRPSLLALTRQNVATVRTAHGGENLTARTSSSATTMRKSRCSRRVRKSISRSRRAAFLQAKASARAWYPCRAGNCSRNNPKHIVTRRSGRAR
jgi:transketolase